MYYIQSIRNNSDAPILIIAEDEYSHKIKRLYSGFHNVFYLIGAPANIDILRNANVSKAQHVVILSYKIDAGSILDVDGVVIANFLQESYPYIHYSVEVMNRSSTQLISYSLFANRNADLDEHLSLSFITGKVLDTTVYYKILSSLRNDPLNIDFIIKMTEDTGRKSLLPIHVNEYLSGKTYKEVYYEFLTDNSIELLCFGVFSCQMGIEINKNIMEIYQRTSSRKMRPDDSDSQTESIPDIYSAEDFEKWMLEKIPVCKILSPEDKYILIPGDILYCYGKIDENTIAEYLWTKKEKEKDLARNETHMNTEDDSEEEEIHNKKVDVLLAQLDKRLKKNKKGRLFSKSSFNQSSGT